MATPLQIVAGLGNPGERYRRTRHNIGFMVIDRLSAHCGEGRSEVAGRLWRRSARLGDIELALVKPLTFMNRSGTALAALVGGLGERPHALTVIHDDLDLDFGRIKIRTDGGHGGHNGIRSIIAELGRRDFTRIKLGIGRPAEGQTVADHVLSAFDEEQNPFLGPFLDRATLAVKKTLEEGPLEAMQLFHTQRQH